MRSINRILLVDDDADDRLYFKDALNEIKPSLLFEVAANGKEALLQVEIPPPPDLIFMDLNMPVMNGYECLAALKKEERFKSIPVVIFTTSKNTIDVERARALGANLFVTKPSDFGTLCSRLEQILDLDFRIFPFTLYN